MSRIPAAQSISEGFPSAAVKEGRVFRSFTKATIDSGGVARYFIEIMLEAPATILHYRQLVTTAGPVEYRAWVNYTLAEDPYLGDVTVLNTNQLPVRGVVRQSVNFAKVVDPSKVIDPDANSDPSQAQLLDEDLVPGSENANRGVGFSGTQDIFFIYPKGTKALIEVKTQASAPPDTQILLKYYFEEVSQQTLLES